MPDNDVNGGLELVGIQFNEAPGIGRTWLSLQRGLNILYGKNGAGKTTVIDQINRFLTGGEDSWIPHRIYVRYPRLALTCSQFEPTDLEGWTSAAIEQLRLLPGLFEALQPNPHGVVAPTEALYECLTSGYLCISRTAPGIDSYMISVAAPLDGSLRFIQKQEIENGRLDKVKRIQAQRIHEAIEQARQGAEYVDYTGTPRKVTPQLIERMKEELSFFEESTSLCVGDFFPQFGFCTEDDDEIDTGWGLLDRKVLPFDRKDEEPDGDHASQYLRLVDIAESWVSPIRMGPSPDSNPALATAKLLISRWLRETGAQEGFSLWATETLGYPRGAVQLMDDSSGPVVLQDDWLDEFSKDANSRYADLLIDAPNMTLKRTKGIRSLTGPPIQWFAYLQDQQTEIELSALSSAENTWARFAIDMASNSPEQLWSSIGLIDEPERGLHRAAESHLAKGLASLAAETGTYMIIATHSPDFLDQDGVNLVEVLRKNLTTRLRPMRDPDRESMRSLGLQPSDLLKRIRKFVLVEGPHDRAVFEKKIGEQLRGSRAQVLHIGGAKQLRAAVEGQFLCDFTEASIIAVLDNLKQKEIADIWRDVKALSASDGFAAALELIEQRLPAGKISTEEACIREFYLRALETGQESRIVPVAMSKPDVIMYLDVQDFVPEAASWDALWEAFQMQLNNRQPIKSFKPWLKAKRHVEIFTEDIERSASKPGQLHPDIVHLLSECRK